MSLTKEGKRRLEDVVTDDLVHVTPEVGGKGKVMQIRKVGDPFQVDAVISNQASKVTLIVKNKQGQTERVDMTRIEISEDSYLQGVAPSRALWTFRGSTDIAGALKFHIEYEDSEGRARKTGEGTLLAVDRNEVLNPLNSRYRVGSLVDFAQASSRSNLTIFHTSPFEKGGIDLDQIKVKRTGKIVIVNFDQAQLQELMQGDFKGFVPVVTDFRFIKSPFPLLGAVPAKEEGSLAKL